VLAPQHMEYETLVPSAAWLAIAGGAALVVGFVVVTTIRRGGIPLVRSATLFPVLGVMVFLLGFHGKDLDLNYSARPLAREMQQKAPEVQVVAVQDIKRDMDYGLAFYRNEPLVHYDREGVPDEEHLLVIRASDASRLLPQWLGGRVYQQLIQYPTQGLQVYLVYAKPR